jgi:hypothetical protein
MCSKPATWESYLRVIAKLFERNWRVIWEKIKHHFAWIQCFQYIKHIQVYESVLKSGPDGTLDQAFKIISWSFNTLLTGKWPSEDWHGKQLCP